jgi:hypothetical protein
MLRFARSLWRLMRGADMDNGCAHDWQEGKMGHRQCRKCPKRQMLYENRYPAPGEPKYEWR